MKEIIKKGTKKIQVCPNCGCKFSYDEEDIIVSKPKIAGYQPPEKSVECPQCKYVISLYQIR